MSHNNRPVRGYFFIVKNVDDFLGQIRSFGIVRRKKKKELLEIGGLFGII